jgi:hypothetical protein
MKRGALYSARGFVIVYAAGLSLFAMDVFQPERAILEMAIEFIIHVSPSLLLLFLLALTWKKPGFASAAFVGAAILFTLFFHTYRSWAQFGFLTVPLIFPAILFLLVARSIDKESS